MKINIALLRIELFMIAFFSFPYFLLAQDGSLDLSFNMDGIVTTPIGATFDLYYSVAIQSDGKIVMTGSNNNSSGWDFALARYNINGSLDTTFDNDGKVTTSFGTTGARPQSVVMQIDGKIVVAGFTGNGSNFDFALVRYITNGSLDTTFDFDGIVTTPIGVSNDYGYSVAMQNDGKIVVAGSSGNGANSYFALARYNNNGSLDTTFDSDGIVTTPIGANDYAFSVAIQSNGKIVAAGHSHNGTNYDFAVVRYNNDGSLDNTFDIDGIVTTPIGASTDLGYSVAIQSDGKIVVAGFSNDGLKDNFAVVRYNNNGSLDTTFDSDGKVTTSIGTIEDRARSIVIQSDRKIVVAGWTADSSGYDFALVRYNPNGNLDTTFDFDGIVTTSIGVSNDMGYSVAIQGDDKIVVAGNSSNSLGYDFALTRYNNNITTGINSNDKQDIEIEIYPNPFSTLANLHSTYILKGANLIVYNIYGEEVKQINNLTGKTFTLNRGNLPSGLYLIRLTQDNVTISNTRIVITD